MKSDIPVANDTRTVQLTEQIPDEITGVWQADNYKWAFKIEKDGSISRIFHQIAGKIKTDEGGVTLDGPDPGTSAIFILGPSSAQFEPESHVLHVIIKLDHFSMKLPGGELQGRTEDYFDGVVSLENTSWQANWRSLSWLDGATPPDINAINKSPEKLIFRKIKL